MQVVPFTSDYDQTFTTTLGGVRYAIDCRWNERGQVWVFDLTRESDQELLVAGVPLLGGQDVLAPYALGVGGIVVADLSNTSTDPGPDDLGDRSPVVFLDIDELAILAAAGFPGIVSTSAPVGTAPVAASSPAPSATPTPTPAPAGSGQTNINTTIINQSVTSLVSIAGGFSDGRPYSDDSGTQILAYQFLYNAGANPGSVLKLVMLLLGTGTGTYRAYVGGTFGTIGDVGTPSGTLVGNGATTGATAPVAITGTPIANPGGIIPIKLTVQSGAPGVAAGVQPTLSGAIF